MKKRLVLVIVIILIIIIAVLSRNNIKKSKAEYTIPAIENYTYVKYKDGEKYGVINREGKLIIEAKYSNIEIPNPQKSVFICYDENKSHNGGGGAVG